MWKGNQARLHRVSTSILPVLVSLALVAALRIVMVEMTFGCPISLSLSIYVSLFLFPVPSLSLSPYIDICGYTCVYLYIYWYTPYLQIRAYVSRYTHVHIYIVSVSVLSLH